MRHVEIIDYSHLAHSYAFGAVKPLSCVLNVDGRPVVFDTTIQAYSIKAINRWSNGGKNPTAVCFDSPCPARKAYFSQRLTGAEIMEGKGYKDGRKEPSETFKTAVNMTANILMRAGVSTYKAFNYEADDLIFACVQNAKKNYPDLPIYVTTGDADLLPLVDDQVSVFFKSRKYTYSVNKEDEKLHYVQVTPENYQEVIEGLSSYKNLTVPYNTLLLAKLLRGDKSDNISGKADWKPKQYKELINILWDNYEAIDELFRYSEPVMKYVYKDTKIEVPQDKLAVTPKENMLMHFSESTTLTMMCDVLSNYIEDDDIEHIRFMYNGMNLNGAFTGLPRDLNRQPARIVKPIKGYDIIALQEECHLLKIKLPM